MELNKIAKVLSGHLSRGRIKSQGEGSHFLLQARDVDSHNLKYRMDNMIRFIPDISPRDCILKKNDILFMSRGARNYSILLGEIPSPVLAAACFFIVRVSSEEVLPGYLCWYMNQAPVEHFLIRHSGRGVHMPIIRRSVLGKIDVPLPSEQIQKKIMGLDALMREEQKLYNHLRVKKKELISATCLKAARRS